MTSFTWFAWGPTLMVLVELLFLYTRQVSNSPHETQNDNLWPCFLGVWSPPLALYQSSTLEFVFYFPKIKGRIFCPYFMSVWGPSSSPLPIIIHSSLFLISWRLKMFCRGFSSMITLPLPSTKSSFTLRSPTKHPVRAKNDWFKHPWKERKVNEKLTNTYLHTRPFRGEKRTDNSWNDS